jgi:hypothetical protein
MERLPFVDIIFWKIMVFHIYINLLEGILTVYISNRLSNYFIFVNKISQNSPIASTTCWQPKAAAKCRGVALRWSCLGCGRAGMKHRQQRFGLLVCGYGMLWV